MSGYVFFSIGLSICAWMLALWLNKKFKHEVFNPLVIATIVIIAVIYSLNIDYKDYKSGGDFIAFFLGPSTVVLAVPLYKQVGLVKKYFKAIIIGIVAGSLTAILTVVALSKIMFLSQTLEMSIIPRSITTPIGIELSKSLNGIPSITVVAIILSGIIGMLCCDVIFKLFGINNPVAKGVAIGTSSHALGTTKALKKGEIEGSMSGLSIAIAGIVTSIIVAVGSFFI